LETILTATAIVCIITSALAVLLVIAERFLVNYGTCVIDVNDGSKKLEIEGGESLLASLMRHKIFIPSACGGRGTCAYCKLKINEGAGAVVPTEMALLTEEEIASGMRLSCQVRVRNDIAVEIPPELFLVKQYSGILEDLRQLTYDILLLRIKLIEPETISFTPGQYVQLMAPAYGKNPEPVYRAYSIASAPSNNKYVELMIRQVPGGICTTYVFEHLKAGDNVYFNGPYGEFRLSDSDREMVWIAGGSGMAPFWSIVHYMKENNIHRPCRCFFGAVKKRDLFMETEWAEIEKELPDFKFIPALSDPANTDEWTGEKGLITEITEKYLKNGAKREAYLCGSPGMIDASIKVLIKNGIPEERIFYDKFA